MKKNINIQPNTLLVPKHLENVANSILTQVNLDNAIDYAYTNIETTEPKTKKQTLKCSQCKKKIGEYYASWELASGVFCKTCYQVEKLTE